MELFCVRNLGPDFSNCQGRLDDLGNSNRTQLVGCRMVHLICLSMLWLTTLGVSSHVPFWFVAQPASLPAPRYPEISVQDGLQSNCTMLARSMVGPCCASSFAGPSLAVSKGCSASWPPNVLVGRCRARLRLPVVQVVPTQVVELPVVEWTPCPPPRRTLCCEAQTRSRLCRREPAPSWWYLLLTGRSASGPSPVLQARNCHGRCAAPSLTVWRTVVLFGLLPGTPAVAEDNPWSDSWAIASQHSRVLPCCPSGSAAHMSLNMPVGTLVLIKVGSLWIFIPCPRLLRFLHLPGPCSWLPSSDVGDISRGNVRGKSAGKPGLERQKLALTVWSR